MNLKNLFMPLIVIWVLSLILIFYLKKYTKEYRDRLKGKNVIPFTRRKTLRRTFYSLCAYHASPKYGFAKPEHFISIVPHYKCIFCYTDDNKIS